MPQAQQRCGSVLDRMREKRWSGWRPNRMPFGLTPIQRPTPVGRTNHSSGFVRGGAL